MCKGRGGRGREGNKQSSPFTIHHSPFTHQSANIFHHHTRARGSTHHHTSPHITTHHHISPHITPTSEADVSGTKKPFWSITIFMDVARLLLMPGCSRSWWCTAAAGAGFPAPVPVPAALVVVGEVFLTFPLAAASLATADTPDAAGLVPTPPATAPAPT